MRGVKVAEREGLPASLKYLSTILAGHPATQPQAGQVETLETRLSSGRFHLAVLGQFKRGKSTLLNALLGESFLPTGIVPITAIPTLIEYGPVRQARITFHGGSARLAANLFAFEFVPLSPDEPPVRLQTPYWTRSALMSGLGLPISPSLIEATVQVLETAAARREQHVEESAVAQGYLDKIIYQP